MIVGLQLDRFCVEVNRFLKVLSSKGIIPQPDFLREQDIRHLSNREYVQLELFCRLHRCLRVFG